MEFAAGDIVQQKHCHNVGRVRNVRRERTTCLVPVNGSWSEAKRLEVERSWHLVEWPDGSHDEYEAHEIEKVDPDLWKLALAAKHIYEAVCACEATNPAMALAELNTFIRKHNLAVYP